MNIKNFMVLARDNFVCASRAPSLTRKLRLKILSVQFSSPILLVILVIQFISDKKLSYLRLLNPHSWEWRRGPTLLRCNTNVVVLMMLSVIS